MQVTTVAGEEGGVASVMITGFGTSIATVRQASNGPVGYNSDVAGLASPVARTASCSRHRACDRVEDSGDGLDGGHLSQRSPDRQPARKPARGVPDIFRGPDSVSGVAYWRSDDVRRATS